MLKLTLTLLLILITGCSQKYIDAFWDDKYDGQKVINNNDYADINTTEEETPAFVEQSGKKDHENKSVQRELDHWVAGKYDEDYNASTYRAPREDKEYGNPYRIQTYVNELLDWTDYEETENKTPKKDLLSNKMKAMPGINQAIGGGSE